MKYGIFKMLRIIKNKTIKEMSEIVNLSPTYISELENGSKNPSLKTLQKYSDALNINISSIMLFSEELKSKSYQEVLFNVLKELLKKDDEQC